MAHYLEIALRGAIENKHTGLIKRLIEEIENSSSSENPSKANMTALNDDGQSFLHYALACGSYDAYKILFPYYQHDHDAHLLSQDKHGKSLFWWSVMRGYDDIAEQLLEYYKQDGVPARDTWLKADNQGINPLHLAASSSIPTRLTWLLDNLGESDDIADIVNLFDEDANTPLHYACRHLRRKHIITLLNVDAAPHLQNKDNKSFFTYLQNNLSFFDEQTLSAKLKSKIVEAHRQLVRDNPDDEELKKFHMQLVSKVSLLEATRSKIEFDCEIDGSLDSATRMVLYPQSEHVSDKLYQLINKDKKLLESCISNITMMADKLTSNNTEISPKRVAAAASSVGGTSLTSFGLFFGALLLANMSAKLSIPLALATLFGVSAGLVIAMPVIMILIGSILIGAAITLHYLQKKTLTNEVSGLISEIKDVLTKLISLEKENVNLLPASVENLRRLEAHVQLLEQSDDKTSKDFATILKKIEPIMAQIGKDIVKRNMPLTRPASPKITKAVSIEEVAIDMIELMDAPDTPHRSLGKSLSSFAGAFFNKSNSTETSMYAELDELHPPTNESTSLLMNDEDEYEEKDTAPPRQRVFS